VAAEEKAQLVLVMLLAVLVAEVLVEKDYNIHIPEVCHLELTEKLVQQIQVEVAVALLMLLQEEKLVLVVLELLLLKKQQLVTMMLQVYGLYQMWLCLKLQILGQHRLNI
jgi:hypothetical protein